MRASIFAVLLQKQSLWLLFISFANGSNSCMNLWTYVQKYLSSIYTRRCSLAKEQHKSWAIKMSIYAHWSRESAARERLFVCFLLEQCLAQTFQIYIFIPPARKNHRVPAHIQVYSLLIDIASCGRSTLKISWTRCECVREQFSHRYNCIDASVPGVRAVVGI